jgi:hypothetical protein
MQPFLVHWDLRDSTKEADIEMILERAKGKYPDAKTADHPRLHPSRLIAKEEIFFSVSSLPETSPLNNTPLRKEFLLRIAHTTPVFSCFGAPARQ